MPQTNTTCCPMCGAASDSQARQCLSCGEELPPASAGESADGPGELRRWVLQRTAWCVAIVFVAAFGMTQPPFGMGGPSVLPAVGFAGGTAVLVGSLLAIRAGLRWQRILAERTGSTLWHRLGRQIRRIFLQS